VPGQGADSLNSDVDAMGLSGTFTIVPGSYITNLNAGVVRFDYGDLDDMYGTTDGSLLGPAKHIFDGTTYLGLLVDTEADGNASADGLGDDADVSDDEDGVVFSQLIPGTNELLVTASVDGFLNAWFDFDNDGSLDEVTVTSLNGTPQALGTTISDLTLLAGTNSIVIDVPSDAAGAIPARFRFSEDAMGAARSPNSIWINGEVEDYVLGATNNNAAAAAGGNVGGTVVLAARGGEVKWSPANEENVLGYNLLSADGSPVNDSLILCGEEEYAVQTGSRSGSYQLQCVHADLSTSIEGELVVVDAWPKADTETIIITDGSNGQMMEAGSNMLIHGASEARQNGVYLNGIVLSSGSFQAVYIHVPEDGVVVSE